MNKSEITNTVKDALIEIGHMPDGNLDLYGHAIETIASKIYQDRRLHIIWNGMRQRCKNPNALMYKNYGKRGIDVCKEWDSFETFKKWALKNGYKDDLTIERINVHLGYYPRNCKWITKKDQQMNKTTSRYLEYDGQRLTVTVRIFCSWHLI